ncbi:hypothetical protein ALQ86_200005 [Pseudomonas amygdali pv. eriobotryae]|uniref:Uncharacterized protein n=1 Tax=Pseudomonas amygdali pv. eriobotryae TaxID=129137 RepID=A0A3M3ADT7_PSEA0|nr:hypothetical protein ALQ86_200005 [Pseudomonas amygdali pv. eriobotryae]
MAQLIGDFFLILMSLDQYIAQIAQAAEHRADLLVQTTRVNGLHKVTLLELVDLLDHYMAQTGQLLDLPTQEERLEFAVIGNEVIDVIVAERLTFRHLEKEHCGKGLVEVQTQNLTEGREAHYWRLAEHIIHAAQFTAVVQTTQNAVAQQAEQRLAGLAL